MGPTLLRGESIVNPDGFSVDGGAVSQTDPVAPPVPRGSAMTREKISTPDAPQPAGSYSQGIRLGNLVWTAGFGPQDPVTGAVPDSVADQTRQVLRNVEATLAAAGLDLGDVVKTTVHLADLTDFAEFNDAYGEFFPYPK